jgi:hypothetical protein
MGQVLQSGCAALEIFKSEYAVSIDQIEVDERVSRQIRFASQVEDLQLTVEHALVHGATLVHEPV